MYLLQHMLFTSIINKQQLICLHLETIAPLCIITNICDFEWCSVNLGWWRLWAEMNCNNLKRYTESLPDRAIQNSSVGHEKHAGACRWRANPLASRKSDNTNAQHMKITCKHTVNKSQWRHSSAYTVEKPLRGLRHISLLTNHLITVETHCLGLHTFDPCTWDHTPQGFDPPNPPRTMWGSIWWTSHLHGHISGLSNHTYSTPGVSHREAEQLEDNKAVYVFVGGQLK